MNYTEVRPNVWHMEEDYRVYCTLVQGETLALLWDTGQGKKDLRAFVEETVKTDYLVLSSHGHADHVSGNFRFSSVLASRADWWLIAAYERWKNGGPPSYALEPLEAGTRFDLGGLHALVVSLPGHTRGSMGLLLEEERLLLAGDALNPTMILLGRETVTLEEFRETLHRAEELPFDTFLASHHPNPIGRQVIQAHLYHLDHLPEHPAAGPSPYGAKVFRSSCRTPYGVSRFQYDRRALGNSETLSL